MTDLEITRLCAEAMGLEIVSTQDSREIWIRLGNGPVACLYCPLQDDAQAMALVKRFEMFIKPVANKEWWVSQCAPEHEVATGLGSDLNRAICECAANRQDAKMLR